MDGGVARTNARNGWRGIFDRLRAAVPPEPPASSVPLSGRLVGYTAALVAGALAVAGLTVHAPRDVSMLVVGGVITFALALMTVRSFGGVNVGWSPSAFVHLALTFALGSLGAFVTALANAVGYGIRMRAGWLRTAVNGSVLFLANVSALATFTALRYGLGHAAWADLAAGAAAGLAAFVVNDILLAFAVKLASGIGLWTFMRAAVEVIPFEVGYGVGGAAFAIYATQGGTALLIGWVVLPMMLQVFLVILARRSNAHQRERERHERERVELLQRIISAADTERTKTASDLHDGPVAHLSGLAMMLSAAAGSDTTDAQVTMTEVATDLREVQRDLRSLIFQLSPHDLDAPGRLRKEIEGKHLQPLAEKGVDTHLDVPDVIPLNRGALELLHRVSREMLANVARHAHAKRVDVAVSVDDDAVELKIDDDGVGFSPDDIARGRADGHFGMRFLMEKAEVARGSLEIDSRPGGGTHTRLRLQTHRARHQG